MKIGVLALQGAFREHVDKLRKENVEVVEVRKSDQLEGLDGLIIPGGESTTMVKLATAKTSENLLEALKVFIIKKKKKPTWGTCAGLILLANNITLPSQKQGGQSVIGGIDITTDRNHFGSQIYSFESVIDIKEQTLNQGPFTGIFIRAPSVYSIDSDKVKILATLPVSPKSLEKDVIIAAQQDNIIVTSFHPELTDDQRWHKYFLRLVESSLYSSSTST